MKKVAICISGQPRFVEKAYPSIKKYLIDQNNDPDIFLHCWFDPKDVGKKFKGVSVGAMLGGVGTLGANIPERLYELYKPVSIWLEPQQNFSERIKTEYTKGANYGNPFATFSMWNSLYKCNLLKKEHEKRMGFKYDVVIKARYDLTIKTPIVLDEISTKEVFVAIENKFLHNKHCNNEVYDILFSTDSNTMDTVAELYTKFDLYFSEIPHWQNELFLAKHLQENNIKISYKTDWLFDVIRNIDSRKPLLALYKRNKLRLHQLGLRGVCKYLKKKLLRKKSKML
jgi:hypothetical protein